MKHTYRIFTLNTENAKNDLFIFHGTKRELNEQLDYLQKFYNSITWYKLD